MAGDLPHQQPTKIKVQRRCSSCHEVGHNIKTCPHKKVAAVHLEEDSIAELVLAGKEQGFLDSINVDNGDASTQEILKTQN